MCLLACIGKLEEETIPNSGRISCVVIKVLWTASLWSLQLHKTGILWSVYFFKKRNLMVSEVFIDAGNGVCSVTISRNLQDRELAQIEISCNWWPPSNFMIETTSCAGIYRKMTISLSAPSTVIWLIMKRRVVWCFPIRSFGRCKHPENFFFPWEVAKECILTIDNLIKKKNKHSS